jgi:D-glycero-D-manno-heptose 1,7-bisphosphate phosphatase
MLPSHIKLVIFDVDGTLVETKSGETFRKTADDWQWLPGRLAKLQELHQQGKMLALASNQGGVAFGYMHEEAIRWELAKTANEVAFGIPYFICCTHPKAVYTQYQKNDERRKPGPGMLIEAQEHFKIGPIHTLMVGDRPEDEQAAQNAGVAFMWADDFFNRAPDKAQTK